MTNFGTDLSARPFQAGVLLSGPGNLLEALQRRMATPKGALFYDPSYGSSLTDWLGEGITDDGLGAAVTAEVDLEEDPRVLSATCEVEHVTTRGITLAATVETALGPFPLVIEGQFAAGAVVPTVEVSARGVG